MIYDPVVGGNTQTGQILGLQYDNATNTLYAIYNDRTTGNYFSRIDPATGIAHPIKLLPASSDNSTFDTNNHLYIFLSGSVLYSINASTGDVVYSVNISATSISYLKYDNTRGKLYGINNSSSLPNPQFVSISPATGAIQAISNLPAIYTSSSNAYTIDEINGKYVFLAQDAASTLCIRNNLYVVDINTGALLSQTLYPYAQNTGAITAENVIGYSFDNQRGILYALNWHPPPTYPYINITASSNPICPGDAITFTATPGATVVDPAYQWVLNSVHVGANSTTYTNTNLQDKDTVYCIITNHELCVVNGTDTSNKIVIRYYTPPAPSVSITASTTQICPGDIVQFKATPVDGGTSPVYQWQVNGTNTGTNSNTFTSTSLQNGDVVNCIMIGQYNCNTTNQATSNNITMQVTSPPNPYPSVTIAASSTTICSGTSTTFTATPANAGASPFYQWQLNGNNVGTNSNSFTTHSLANGDIVKCIMNGNITCVAPVSSNIVTMTVNEVPNVFTGNDTIIAPGNIIPLHPVVTGTIANYEWTPALALNNPSIKDPVATPDNSITYQLKVITDAGCRASDKMTITVYRMLHMPNAFSPNGDGSNEVFRIPLSTPQKIKGFSVFNRWGHKIFTTTDGSQGWDGTYKNQLQPAGAYVWQIEYEDLLTRKIVLAKGTVILVR